MQLHESLGNSAGSVNLPDDLRSSTCFHDPLVFDPLKSHNRHGGIPEPSG